MRWERLWNYLKKAAVEEIEFILDTVAQEIEDTYRKFKKKLFAYQYLIFGVIILVVHLVIFIRILGFGAADGMYKAYWQPILPIVSSTLMIIFSWWIEHKRVAYLVCFVGYVPYITLLEFGFLMDDRLLSVHKLEFQLVFILYIIVVNHWLLILIFNQRTKVYSILVPLDRIYLITRIYVATESIRTVLFVKAAIMMSMQMFFLYYSKQFSLKMYQNVVDKEKRITQILSLLDIASPFPVYLFHLDARLSAFVADQVSQERPTQRANHENLRDLLCSLTIEVFHCDSIEKKKVKPAEVVEMLDSIQFHSESTFLATRNSKVIDASTVNGETADRLSSTMLGKLLTLTDFEGHTSLDVIVTILETVLDNIKEVHGIVFSLKDLNNNSIFNHNDFRIFDIDLMILTLEGQNFFTVTVKEFTKRVIMDKHSSEIEPVDISISSIVHDMRAPLQAILGYTENLEYRIQKLHGDKVASLQASKKIKAYCQHLDQLTNDILDSTRITNSKLVINVSMFDLKILVDDSIDMAKTLQKSQNLVFLYSGPAKLQVCNDRYRLKRILMNLLSNSVKNTEAGSITIQVEVIGNNLIKLSVADTGKGISQQVQRGLFNPFKNYEDAQNIQGIGLGLATTRELVGRLGPNKQIEVTSQVGKGSVFTFKVYLDYEAEKPSDVCNNMVSQPFIKIRDSNFKTVSQMAQGKERARSLMNNRINNLDRAALVHRSPYQIQDSLPPIYKTQVFRNINRENLARAPILKKASMTSQEKLPSENIPYDRIENDCESPNQVGTRLPRLDEETRHLGGSPLLSSYGHYEYPPSFFILEDDLFNQEILSSSIVRFLEENIHFKDATIIDRSESGELALALLEDKLTRDFYYNIIFTDFNLEGAMTGLDFAWAVNDLYTSADVPMPVIVLTSGNERPDSPDDSPFRDVLMKPFTYEQLARILKKYMFGITSEG